MTFIIIQRFTNKGCRAFSLDCQFRSNIQYDNQHNSEKQSPQRICNAQQQIFHIGRLHEGAIKAVQHNN